MPTQLVAVYRLVPEEWSFPMHDVDSLMRENNQKLKTYNGMFQDCGIPNSLAIVILLSWNKFLIWVRSRRCGCLITWFCYQLIAKSGNKTAAPSWPDPYISYFFFTIKDIEMAHCKSAPWPHSYQWRCWSLPASHWYIFTTKAIDGLL